MAVGGRHRVIGAAIAHQLGGAERAAARGMSPSARGSPARSSGDHRRTAGTGCGSVSRPCRQCPTRPARRRRAGSARFRWCFVRAYPEETAEAFCDGHNAAFGFFGKVPRSILYDNTRLAVARILGAGVRQRTRVFSELQSHYVFADRFGRPGKGNDKGKVEGLVGWIRRNLLVPVPRATKRRCAAGPSQKSGSCVRPPRSLPGPRQNLPAHDRDRAAAAQTPRAAADVVPERSP